MSTTTVPGITWSVQCWVVTFTDADGWKSFGHISWFDHIARNNGGRGWSAYANGVGDRPALDDVFATADEAKAAIEQHFAQAVAR